MHFHREIDHLKRQVMDLGTLVEDRLRQACILVDTCDPELAQQIYRSDWEVDEQEIHVEEECLKVLALHQPVARDLRLIITILRVNTELERIGDIAVNISKRILSIEKRLNGQELAVDFQPMCAKVLEMLKKGLDAMITQDAGKARQLFIDDDEVDHLRDDIYKVITSEMKKRPEDAVSLLNQYLISRHLERVGDRITNIAETVLYLVEGEIVRGDSEEE